MGLCWWYSEEKWGSPSSQRVGICLDERNVLYLVIQARSEDWKDSFIDTVNTCTELQNLLLQTQAALLFIAVSAFLFVLLADDPGIDVRDWSLSYHINNNKLKTLEMINSTCKPQILYK